MNRFPASVRRAMRKSGAHATCVPVQFDDGDWETALFIQLSGRESTADRRVLSQSKGPLPVGVETDLLENEHAAVVVLRLEVHTQSGDPLAFEILLTPGNASGHFDTLQQLTRQPHLRWFFADRDFRIVHAQQHALSDEQRAGFNTLLQDAAVHDAFVRCTGRYDARAALAAVASHYDLRTGGVVQQS